MIKQNIGIVNALIRITAGFTMLAWVTSKMDRWPYRDSYLIVAICGAMKVAEGIVRFCPVTYLFESYQNQDQNGKQQNTKQDQNQNTQQEFNLDDFNINPS